MAEGRPAFQGRGNIAVKIPAHAFEAIVAFYCDTLGLAVVETGRPWRRSRSARTGSGSIA